MPGKAITNQERTVWYRVLIVLQIVGFVGLFVSFWRIAVVAITVGAVGGRATGVLTMLDELLGLYVAAFIIVDGWVLYHLRSITWRLVQFLTVSFGMTIGLAFITIGTAPLWQNVVFFLLVTFASGSKVFIARTLFRAEPTRAGARRRPVLA